MTAMTEEVGRWVWWPTDKVEEAWWNMNKMEPLEYAALREDMKLRGPQAIDPLLVASKRVLLNDPDVPEDLRVCVDGNHRLRIAKELGEFGWNVVRIVFDNSIISEELARAISYNKNYERGRIDPWKEAENFKWLSDKGWTQDSIAAAYHIDRSQVSKRISLLNITPEVKEQVKKVPHVTVSHLEPIATMTPELQKEVIRRIKRSYDEPTVAEVADTAERVKTADKEKREFEAAVSKAKFKKCPDCHGNPVEKSWSKGGLPWVHCKSYHEWSLETGREKRERPSEGTRTKPKGKKQFEGFLRTTHTVEEVGHVMTEYARSLVGEFAEISSIRIEGKSKSGREAFVRAEGRPTVSGISTTASFNSDLGKKDEDFSAEPKSYASKRLKDIKALVRTWPEPKNKNDLRKFEMRLKELFSRFGKKRRVRKVKKAGKKK